MWLPTLAVMFSISGILSAQSADEGVTLCLQDKRKDASEIVAYGTDIAGEEALRRLFPDAKITHLEWQIHPLRIFGVLDKNADDSPRVAGILLHDRDVAVRDNGRRYGYMVAGYSTAPDSYECAVIAPIKTCFATPMKLPVIAACK